MITFNVSGSRFVTSRETIQDCKELADYFDTGGKSNEIFLDRDPKAFAKMLKLLRGYHCPDYVFDMDVLCELVYWDHAMLRIQLPEWIKPQPLTVHTLDPQQSEQYQETHGLLPLEAIQRLIKMHVLSGPISRFVTCKAVAALQGWTESAWVEKSDIEMASIKWCFLEFFNAKWIHWAASVWLKKN